MVRQWQRLFYNERYSATELEDTPDFVMLAKAYGWEASVVEDPDKVEQAFEAMLASEGPYLLDMHIERDQSVFPMVAPGKALTEVIGPFNASGSEMRIIEREEDLTPEERGVE